LVTCCPRTPIFYHCRFIGAEIKTEFSGENSEITKKSINQINKKYDRNLNKSLFRKHISPHYEFIETNPNHLVPMGPAGGRGGLPPGRVPEAADDVAQGQRQDLSGDPLWVQAVAGA